MKYTTKKKVYFLAKFQSQIHFISQIIFTTTKICGGKVADFSKYILTFLISSYMIAKIKFGVFYSYLIEQQVYMIWCSYFPQSLYCLGNN